MLGPPRSGDSTTSTLTRDTGRAIGAELAAVGINLDFAPVADVNTNPDNPVIGTRTFGADPARSPRTSPRGSTGLQSAGVAACAKHFPGHGDTAADSHLALPRSTSTSRPCRAASSCRSRQPSRRARARS